MYLHFYGNSLGQTGGLGPLWSEGQKVRCLAAGQRLLQQQFAGNGWHKKTDFKGLQTFYQQEPGTHGPLPPSVRLSPMTVSSHVHLQMGSPPPKRAVQWDRGCRHQREKTYGWLQNQRMEGKEESSSFVLNGSGGGDSGNARTVAYQQRQSRRLVDQRREKPEDHFENYLTKKKKNDPDQDKK